MCIVPFYYGDHVPASLSSSLFFLLAASPFYNLVDVLAIVVKMAGHNDSEAEVSWLFGQ